MAQINMDKLYALHPYLKDVVSCIQDAGGIPYLVGGCVRDLYLGETPGDLDIEVFALDQDALRRALESSYHVEFVGQSFGVYILKGLPVDIALPRKERQTGPKHTDFDVECDPNLSLREAAARRDFTINAIYYNLIEDQVEDPYQGLEALEAGILKHTSTQFAEDALRVYRAMQFIARFNLICDADTLELCRSIDGSHLPQERIFAEFEKLLLKGKRISDGLDFLKDCGWIHFFPELEDLIGCEQDPHWHPEGDVWRHTLLSLNAFANRRIGDDKEDLLVGLAVLCHDMGKPDTSFVENGRIRSPGHDVVGLPLARQFLERITRDKSILEGVSPLVKEHMIPLSLQRSNAGNAALRRLALRVRVDRLLRVCQADREGREDPWQPQVFPEGDWLEAKMNDLSLKNTKPNPIILGRDLIQLGLKPGKKIGKILEQVFQAQLDGVFENHEDGIEYLKDLLKKN